ncbi:YqzL family protein [Bacillus coahuilensis]|nr:YqzL family protein [Bacillus coahuilensis]
MLDFTWKVFSETGNIDTYLLFKELEGNEDGKSSYLEHTEQLVETDFPLS